MASTGILNTFYRKVGKRALDIVGSAALLVLLSPVMAVTAVAVDRKLGRPVIFTQERPGKIDETIGQERIFKMCKFRTMTDGRDAEGNLLPDEDRLTPFGKKLRSTSLDELPELWNILKGDMSFVGPRPLLVAYLDRYTPEQRRRHEVRPGLTGLAQVSGRNGVDWETRFAYDVDYVDNCSFAKDAAILWKTFRVVVMREGITSETSETMEAFIPASRDARPQGTPERAELK